MKRLFFLLLTILVSLPMTAQTDTLSLHQKAQLDSSLAKKGIFDDMPSNVSVNQDQSVKGAYLSILEKNQEGAQFTGFRIKIFQSSAQSARTESENAVVRFRDMFPDIPAYRSFSSPYFKVSVGDFRTRVEAEKLLRQIRQNFPTATVVKEKMKYPSLDSF